MARPMPIAAGGGHAGATDRRRPVQCEEAPIMSPCSPPVPPSPPDAGRRTVFCVKLQKELPGLEAPTWPGELGQRIFEHVSAEAWRQWEDRMKMILNEYRLLPFQKEAQDLVARHMEEFFFGETAAPPPGYVPEQT